jgi:integrase
MEKEGVGEKTAYDRLVVVKQMFKSAARLRLIPSSPFAGLAMHKPESAQQPCFTPEQITTMLEKADAHLKPLAAMLAYAGLRFGEARDLLWSDLVLESDSPGFIVFRRGGSAGTTKGKRQRRIPIHPELRRILDAMSRPFDRVFTALPSPKFPDGGAALNERRCLVALKRLCKRCGFANPKQYKLHTFRHTFASMCARNNVSYKYALEWMGHRSSDILDLYYTMFDADAHAAMTTLVYPQPSKPTENAGVFDACDKIAEEKEGIRMNQQNKEGNGEDLRQHLVLPLGSGGRRSMTATVASTALDERRQAQFDAAVKDLLAHLVRQQVSKGVDKCPMRASSA